MNVKEKPGLTITIAETTDHFKQILKLQQVNQRDNLSIEDQSEQGFLYASYSISLLEQMANYSPQLIALHNDKVVGYNLSISLDLVNIMPDLRTMFYAFNHTLYKGHLLGSYTYVIGGQVCVEKAYRGYGLFKLMYKEMKNRLSNQYQLCVTDVSQRNTRSLNAHLKTGFEIAGTYPYDDEIWHTVVWNWRT